jgi:hypothetical protein
MRRDAGSRYASRCGGIVGSAADAGNGHGVSARAAMRM